MTHSGTTGPIRERLSASSSNRWPALSPCFFAIANGEPVSASAGLALIFCDGGWAMPRRPCRPRPARRAVSRRRQRGLACLHRAGRCEFQPLHMAAQHRAEGRDGRRGRPPGIMDQHDVAGDRRVGQHLAEHAPMRRSGHRVSGQDRDAQPGFDQGERSLDQRYLIGPPAPAAGPARSRSRPAAGCRCRGSR